MKVVITGHMNGLGLSLYNKLKDAQYIISGYDLENNKDITKSNIISELLSDCIDADIFINNAYPNQSLLLTRVFNSWIGQNKTIINISSAITHFPLTNEFESLNNYIANKKLLDKMVDLHRSRNTMPYIMNIRPSWFESNLAKEFDTKKIHPNDIANLIIALYNMKDAIKIADIVIEK